MMRRKLTSIPVFIFIAFFFFIGGCESGDGGTGTANEEPQQVAKPSIGYLAPDFTLLNVEGKPVTLSEEKGKVLLLNFWATWCTPCRVEMPSMQALYQSFDRSEFEILSISSDFEGARVVKPFMDAFQLTFPALIDDAFKVSNLYQVRSVPSTYIIDQEGVITHRFIGAKTWNDEASIDMIRKLIRSG